MKHFRRIVAMALFLGVMIAVSPVGRGQDLTAFQNLGRDLRESIATSFGYTATGSNYATRRLIGNVFDDVFVARQSAPGFPTYHPFLQPSLRCFTRAFFLQSLDELIDAMDAGSPSSTGVRFYYVQASGVIAEVWLPNDSDGTLEPYRIGFDLSDDIVWLAEIIEPTCLAHAAFDFRWAALADRIDVLFVSHVHPDHWAPRIVTDMIARGKPVFVPQDMYTRLQALSQMSPPSPTPLNPQEAIDELFGLPFSSPLLTVLLPGRYSLRTAVEVDVFLGEQTVGAGNPVENNVLFVNFDVPVDVTSGDQGITFVHFGDQNGPGLVAHVAGLVASGYVYDDVVVANYSNYEPQVGALLDFDVRLITPTYELAHFFALDANVGMKIPESPGAAPPYRVPLFWGEGVHYPNDLP